MDGVRGVMIETASAQLTAVQFLSRVEAPMSRQIRLCEEGFGAELTLERFVTRVDVFVLSA